MAYSIAAKTPGVSIRRSIGHFGDETLRQPVLGCRLAISGSFARAEVGGDASIRLREGFIARGWKEMAAYSADGKDGTSFAFRDETVACLFRGQWNGGADGEPPIPPEDWYRVYVICTSPVFPEERRASANSGVAEIPRLPYEHWAACPFECCSYRKWTSRADLNVRRSRDNRSPVAFRIRKGEIVEAITGVVVTRKPGVVEITETKSFGAITLPQEAVVYTLHFEGEGSDFFCYQGQASSGELYAVVSEPTPAHPRRVRSLPVTEWWVNVKNGRGQTGWIFNSVTSGRFDRTDACG